MNKSNLRKKRETRKNENKSTIMQIKTILTTLAVSLILVLGRPLELADQETYSPVLSDFTESRKIETQIEPSLLFSPTIP